MLVPGTGIDEDLPGIIKVVPLAGVRVFTSGCIVAGVGGPGVVGHGIQVIDTVGVSLCGKRVQIQPRCGKVNVRRELVPKVVPL